MERPTCKSCIHFCIDRPSDKEISPRFECRYDPPSIPVEVNDTWYKIHGEVNPHGSCRHHPQFKEYKIWWTKISIPECMNCKYYKINTIGYSAGYCGLRITEEDLRRELTFYNLSRIMRREYILLTGYNSCDKFKSRFLEEETKDVLAEEDKT